MSLCQTKEWPGRWIRFWWHVWHCSKPRCLFLSAMVCSVWAWFLGFPTGIGKESQELSAADNVDLPLANGIYQWWSRLGVHRKGDAQIQRFPTWSKRRLSGPFVASHWFLHVGILPCKPSLCVSPGPCGSCCKPCWASRAAGWVDDHLERDSVVPSLVAIVVCSGNWRLVVQGNVRHSGPANVCMFAADPLPWEGGLSMGALEGLASTDFFVAVTGASNTLARWTAGLQ